MIGIIIAVAALIIIIGIAVKLNSMRKKEEELFWKKYTEKRIVEYIEGIDALFDTNSNRFKLIYETELGKEHQVQIYRDLETSKYLHLVRYLYYKQPHYSVKIKDKKRVLAQIIGQLENQREKMELYDILNKE